MMRLLSGLRRLVLAASAGMIVMAGPALAAPAANKAAGVAPSVDQLGVDGQPFDPAKADMMSKSTTLRSVMWANMRVLPVCWENPLPQHEANRQRARAAVAQIWEAAANVQFTGWGTCQPGEMAVRIAVMPREWPRALVGRWSLRRETSVWLNFDLPAMPGFSDCARKLERCESFIAVHEFGHVLGLIHEQDRPDTPDACRRSLGAGGVVTRSGADLVKLTGYDPESLMNYCSLRGWDAAQPLVLTAEDKIGIVTMFGARPAAMPASAVAASAAPGAAVPTASPVPSAVPVAAQPPLAAEPPAAEPPGSTAKRRLPVFVPD